MPVIEKMSCITALSLFRAHAALIEAGIGAELAIRVGDCHVDDARNALVRQFLDSDCSDFVFIDADVGFQQKDLLRLLEFDRDVVGGAYPKKNDRAEYPVWIQPDEHGQTWSDEDGLIECIGIGAGFLRIRRSVIERMAKGEQHFTIIGDGDSMPMVFERLIVDGKRFSGDYAFCRKWREMGGRVYADPQCYLEHEGPKVWSGTLATFLRRESGLALIGQIERIKAGTETNQDYIDLMMEWDNDPWNAGVELLKATAQAARLSKGPILETGSGLTTLIMAAANQNMQLHCLEHSPVWAARVASEAKRLNLFNIVIHCKPLADGWYDINDLPAADWGLVLHDGPPRQEGDRSRLWTTVGAKLNGAMVLVDDVDDRAQLEPAREWAAHTRRDLKIMGAIRPFALIRPGKEAP